MLIKRTRGWELGEPIYSFTRRSDATPLTLHRVSVKTNADP